jgi:hypothetical protein
MRTAIVMLMILVFAGSALAADLGSVAPVKDSHVVPYIQPETHKQGGDTIFDATPIPGLPYLDTGTTIGYMNDYDEACPYTGSTSPDVVYSFVAEFTGGINVDLCNSQYDTKTYVYDSGLGLIACNDDFYFGDPCWIYSSRLENVPVMSGMTYYIVVDGYGGDAGTYELVVEQYEECYVFCPSDAVPEGEPPIQDGYDDQYNSGCGGMTLLLQEIDWINVEEGNPLDGLAWMCANSGWYLSADGFNARDTDWFKVIARETGVMEFTVESEHPCYIFKLAPTDCANVAVELQATADCEQPATLAFPVQADEEVWLWVGPTTFEGPVTEFTYFATFSNNLFDVVPAEEKSFGDVKAMYR